MRSWLPLLLLSVLLLLAGSGPCLAVEGSHEGGHERSMFEKALDLGIWTLVIFLLLLLILSKYAWGPMLQGLEKREKDIAQAKEDADKAREEAATLRQELQAEMSKGQEKIREMIEEARRDAEQLRERQKAEAAAEIAADRDRLRRELATARDQALKEMWGQTAALAAMISSKAVRRQMTPEDHQHLLDEAIGDLERVLSERN